MLLRCPYARLELHFHLATKLAGSEKLYGQAKPQIQGTPRSWVCSDCTLTQSINPVAYEDGEAIFIDTEYETLEHESDIRLEKHLNFIRM